MGMLSEHSKLCSCKWRTLTQSDLANSLVVRVENVTNYLLVCWHLAKIMNTVNTSCLLYLGLEVHKKAMIRDRYNRIPHPALNTKRERDTHNQVGTKTKTAQAKRQGDSSFEGQRVFEQ